MSASTRIFLSFDVAHDRDLSTRLHAEAKKGSWFSIEACSGEPADDTANDARVRERISGVDAVIVICGEFTDECAGISAELRITREQHKPHMLLWGRREIMCKKPAGSRADESMYGWTPHILQSQLSALLRTRDVPEHLRKAPPKPFAVER
jgi:hypothetical protein